MANPWELYIGNSYVGPSISGMRKQSFPYENQPFVQPKTPYIYDRQKEETKHAKKSIESKTYKKGAEYNPYKYSGIDGLTGVLETADYLSAAPVRYGIMETIQGLKNGDAGPWNFFKGVAKSFENPRTAPTGKDISRELGFSDKGLNQITGDQYAPNISPAGAAGFALENMLDPTNLFGAGLFGAGIKAVGKLDDVARAGKTLSKADDILPRTSKEYQENFKNWFGDSKVVDKDGRPQVVYHGTRNDIEGNHFKKNASKIDAGYFGSGHYFTSKPSVASSYAHTGSTFDNTGNQVLPVYLNIKNPLEVSSEGFRAFLSKNKIKGYDETPYTSEMISKKLSELGYDGVIIDGGDEIVAFNPTQIKSATGNRGTFDPKDPNILRALMPIAGGGAIYGQQNNRQKDADGKRSK